METSGSHEPSPAVTSSDGVAGTVSSGPADQAGGTHDAEEGKIDPITALQDGIDGLSLAMFEALRRLRDAVAPDSGNLGVAANAAANDSSSPETAGSTDPDMDELWNRYRSNDPDVVAMLHKVSGGVVLQKREDFIRVHAKMEMEKDTELVMNLAGSVLQKSAAIDEQVDALPGINRTRSEQMKRISELVDLNRKAVKDLEDVYEQAKNRRDSCRSFIMENTGAALGIEDLG